MIPAAKPRRVSAISGAPDSDRREASSGAVSFVPISISRRSSISPVSIPASIRIVVTPVRVSPFTMAQLMGAAPRYLGEQGSVQIDPAQFRNRQQPRRNNLSVSDDHHAIGRQRLQQRHGFRRPNLFRLMHRNIRRQRRYFHWRKRNFLPAPARAIRLRDDPDDFKVRLHEEMFK